MKRYKKEKCPYEIEYNKLSEKEKSYLAKPCNDYDCTLDPIICTNRLAWAYNKSQEEK